MRILTTGLLILGLGASTAAAQTEYRVIRRDTSIHPVYTGFDPILSLAKSGAYPRVDKVHADSPASRAGLKVGDELLSVDSLDLGVRTTKAWYKGPGVPATLRVRRGDSVLTLTIIPEKPAG